MTRLFAVIRTVFILPILSSLSFSAIAALPIANDDSRTVEKNAIATINVLANDADPDPDDTISLLSAGSFGGDSDFAESEQGGSIVINNDGSVTYTPPLDFVGRDSFTYEISDGTSEGTATATVRINVVDSLFRNAATNDNQRSFSQVLDSVCDAVVEEPTDISRFIDQQCATLRELARTSPEAAAAAISSIAPEETASQMRVAIDSSRNQTKAVAQRVQQLRTSGRRDSFAPSFAINGKQVAGGGASADSSSIASKWGVFGSVQIEDADREESDLESGYDSSANTLQIGADYFVNQNLLLGSTLGVTQADVDYSQNSGALDTDLTTLTAFTAWFANDFSAMAQLGYGWVSFDSLRNIEYASVEERVTGSTEGTQLMLNTRVDYEWRSNAWTLVPFLRADYLDSEVDAYAEQGSGFAMSLGEQSSSQLTLSAGLQASYSMSTSWGVLLPKFGFTYYSESDSDRDPIQARFAFDTDDDRSFTLTNDGGDDAFYQVSLGASALFQNGWSGFVTYNETLGYDNLDASQFQLGFRREL